ncbi:MAG: cyclic nucleotide-binding domain-containing protein [Myxococcaceae bacterium]|nr:cyclic nucleotide-binding domain-containing protein [Myxococcaceae bacterium]
MNQVKIELVRADVTTRVEKDPVLAGSRLVKALGPRWRDVLKQGRAKRAGDRAVIFQQGDPGESLVFVLSGHVRLFARKDADTVEIGLAHAGDVVGEAEAVAGKGLRVMSAVASGVVELLELDRAPLFSLGQPVSRALEQWLSELQAQRLKALDEMADFLNRW